ncbi:hypothetical protein [Maridesulfovibrio salexigens]|uniref:Uncharacterized protein n=1 Tax=Maridesulfovibrio salexigens (strain ATCC 14822 / DSM 2638 / NCIMB 8403 / VKM B-1763) TaxID=526222 RepID=C6BVR9_MARSD|nr:hypothetical protein [Maridesulfovibrio salexigens]ACS78283.1 hypothetical protein Desal_0215 [Maridesulfovibrio salexigens DSM 2638]
MAGVKKLTDRFLIALFRRGKADYLPPSYLETEGGKVLAPGETDKLQGLLAEMTGKGILEEKGGEYKLLSDPYA